MRCDLVGDECGDAAIEALLLVGFDIGEAVFVGEYVDDGRVPGVHQPVLRLLTLQNYVVLQRTELHWPLRPNQQV